MSDFDDEPIEEPAEDPTPAKAKAPKKAPKPAPDDDWDDDWDDDDDRGGRRDLTLVYAVVAAAIVIVLAIVLTRDNGDDGGTAAPTTNGQGTEQPAEIVKNWDAVVGDAVGENGADAQARAEAAPGVYIWTDFGGWHVRSNGESDVVVTVTAPQVRQKATDDYDDGDEKGDAPFKTEAVVTIPAGGGTEGPGFDLGGSESATFAITIDGRNVPVDQIFLGGAQGTADENPVQFTKS